MENNNKQWEFGMQVVIFYDLPSKDAFVISDSRPFFSIWMLRRMAARGKIFGNIANQSKFKIICLQQDIHLD